MIFNIRRIILTWCPDYQEKIALIISQGVASSSCLEL